MNRYATAGLACSPSAATGLYGSNWDADGRWQVLPYGFDFSRFANLPASDLIRAQLGIPKSRKVIGQVARLSAEKNHEFTLQILATLIKRGIDAHLLLVGKGPRES